MVTGPLLVALFVVSLVVLIFMISRFRIHAFLSLIFISIALGLATKMKPTDVIKTVTDGFGGLMGSIGIVIIAGVIIGEVLEITGGAQKIADFVLRIVGAKRTVLATGFTGAIVSIPVFCDSGYVILNPVIRALSAAGKIPYMSLATALMAGLLTTHALVPPTPGPIAAAGILGADLGKVVLYGIITAIPIVVVSAAWANSRFLKQMYPAVAEEVPAEELGKYKEIVAKAPSTFMSFLPIVVPIILIVVQSFSKQWIDQKSLTAAVINFIGTPAVALLLGVLLSWLLPTKINGQVTDTWVTTAMEKSVNILLITAAGGAFGKILQATQIGDYLGQLIISAGVPAFLVPFLISALSVTAQGSATVALLTTSAIIQPLLGTLGLSPELAVLAIAVGSFTVVHSNGSYFWVVSKLGNMNLKQSYWAVTFTTLVMGITGIVTVAIMSLFV